MSKKVKRAKKSTPKTIRNAMRACQEKGLEIASQFWGTSFDEEKGYFVPDEDENGVCALGALLVHKNGSLKFDKFRGERALNDSETNEIVAWVLGVNKDWVDCFTAGFDGELVQHLDVSYNLDKDPDEENPIFKKTKSLQVKEYRRAYNMGKKLAKEFDV